MRNRLIFIILMSSFLAVFCSAETIIVDPNGFYDFDNIQNAINYSDRL